MASYSPLAVKIFSSPAISTQKTIALAYSLVVSKLIYNVHVWSRCDGIARRQLNTIYMKLWRRIANKSRYRAGCGSDLSIRESLDIPSLDCLLRRNRLKYLSRVFAANVPALEALLHSRGKANSKLPWVELIVADMHVLYSALPSRFPSFSLPD